MGEPEKLILRRSGDGGWQIVWAKPYGLNKGETVLATTCGGNMGKALATAILKQASSMTLVTDISIEE